MRFFIASAVMAAGLALTGCGSTAHVAIRTDGNGRIAGARVVGSAGSDKLDTMALTAAKAQFPNKVRRPAKNKTYIQPVYIR
ncbi:hypothetical protein QBK99_03500 [Corticibacterium sp. UT-5YL-CI-8]|nr:hypothetical protein [Tianweitania sp. UT-5YL-CI-8]